MRWVFRVQFFTNKLSPVGTVPYIVAKVTAMPNALLYLLVKLFSKLFYYNIKGYPFIGVRVIILV